MDKTINGVPDTTEVKVGDNAPVVEGDQTVTIKADETATQPAVDETTTEVDYEAQLAEERKLREQADEARKKAEDKIVELKRKSKQSKVEVEGFEEDIPEISETERLEKILAERDEKLRREFAKDSLEAELEKITSNPKERELIKYHYENTIRTTGVDRGSIRRDLERASIIANAPKAKKVLGEIKESLKSKNVAKNTSAGTNQDVDQVVDTKFTPQELAIMQRFGIDPKTVKKD